MMAPSTQYPNRLIEEHSFFRHGEILQQDVAHAKNKRYDHFGGHTQDVPITVGIVEWVKDCAFHFHRGFYSSLFLQI